MNWWKRLFLLPPQKLIETWIHWYILHIYHFGVHTILLIQVFELGPDRFNRVCVFLWCIHKFFFMHLKGMLIALSEAVDHLLHVTFSVQCIDIMSRRVFASIFSTGTTNVEDICALMVGKSQKSIFSWNICLCGASFFPNAD